MNTTLNQLKQLTMDVLKDYLLQYNIDQNDIVGTGKNGKVLKRDYVNKLLLMYNQHLINI